MNNTLCKNCNSVLEDSSKGHFCGKSCIIKYIRKKVKKALPWVGITAGTALVGIGTWQVTNILYDELYPVIDNPKELPCSPSFPTVSVVPKIQEIEEYIPPLENETEAEEIPTEYKEVGVDSFLRKLSENRHPSLTAINNARENGIDLDPAENITFVKEHTRNIKAS